MSSVAQHTFLVFLASVNCKKLLPCEYFTMFTFMFILKLQLLKLNNS